MKRKGCAFPTCERKHSAKGFCTLHYNQFIKGWLTEDGSKTDTWKGKVEKQDHCLFCTLAPTKKGFCNRHYKWLRKGFCTEQGVMLKEPPVATKDRYADVSFCKVDHCEEAPRKSGFCRRHYAQYRSGKYNPNGALSRKGAMLRQHYDPNHACLVCGVRGEPKYVRGFCKPHYEKFRKGFYLEDGTPTGKKLKRLLDTQTMLDVLNLAALRNLWVEGFVGHTMSIC